MPLSPNELHAFVDATIRKLKDAGLNAGALERVQSAAYTTGSEWRGELGLALWKIAGQDIRDEAIWKDLDLIAMEVRRAWPGFPRARKNSIHPALRTSLWLNQFVGMPLMALIAAGIFRSVVAAAIRGDEDWPLLLLRAGIGLIFVWAAAHAWTSGRWYRRVSRLVQQSEAVPVNVEFGWLEHALVATVRPKVPGQFPGRSVVCGPPDWKVDLVKGTEILGYVDPDPRGPVVLETACGLIWPLERGSVEVLKE